ncbi:hypothetical protein GLOIN_2v1885045 [Rhizophagus irregularis DAOM 181602=DAOM 197198]|nr:hypothetical protein GLOIN_2v1885045 [Rhizophagus irregularis DAOM 181602=DAOM 197198]
MSTLVEDVLRLILEELKYDRISLHSCILVNKTWWAEHCFSKLESFRCYANTNKYILEGLAGISKSIKKLIFDIMYSINSGIIKLIEAQNNLKEVHFIDHTINLRDESFSRPLEESLIKHANTIQYLRIDWKPNTEILSYLVNLISLDINLSLVRDINWNHLEKLSLPLLKFLRTQKVPSRILSNIIENTKGYLTEISILYEAEQRKQKQQELQQLENLIKEYKVKEMIKRYYVDSHGSAFEDFEWIQRRSDAYIEF